VAITLRKARLELGPERRLVYLPRGYFLCVNHLDGAASAMKPLVQMPAGEVFVVDERVGRPSDATGNLQYFGDFETREILGYLGRAEAEREGIRYALGRGPR